MAVPAIRNHADRDMRAFPEYDMIDKSNRKEFMPTRCAADGTIGGGVFTINHSNTCRGKTCPGLMGRLSAPAPLLLHAGS